MGSDLSSDYKQSHEVRYKRGGFAENPGAAARARIHLTELAAQGCFFNSTLLKRLIDTSSQATEDSSSHPHSFQLERLTENCVVESTS